MRALRPVYMVTVGVVVGSGAGPARRAGAGRSERAERPRRRSVGARRPVAGAGPQWPEDDERMVVEHGTEAGHVAVHVTGDVVGVGEVSWIVVDRDDGDRVRPRRAVRSARPRWTRRPVVVLVVGRSDQGAHGGDLGPGRRAGRTEVRGRVSRVGQVCVSR